MKKLMRGFTFYPATANGRANGDRTDSGRSIYLDNELRPTSLEEAQQYTNHTILRVGMHAGRVFDATWWEGEYVDRWFHSQTCAAAFGRRAARQGVRFDAEGINLEEIFSV